jgi:hypothetical protein
MAAMKEPQVKRRFITLIIGFLAWLCATAVTAATTPELYEVEILVFQTTLTYLEGEELWTKDVVNTKLPGVEKAVDLPDTPALNSALWKMAATLETGGDYQVLYHRRWLLPAEPRPKAEWLYLSETRSDLPALEGTFRFYQSRFLHIEVQLLLRERLERTLVSSRTPAPLPKIYRINEQRRIRTGQMNYFDHPKFGALLHVNQVDKKR